MKRILVCMLALWITASCGGKGEKSAKTPPASQENKPVQMIPDEDFTEFERLAEAYIKPYFDEAGTKSEATVKRGDKFDLYVFGEHSTMYPMSAAEYRLVIPSGITVLSQANCDSTILTLGKHDDDFMIAYRCAPGPKMWLVRYTCLASDSARGGTVGIEKGHTQNYLGFAMCDEQRTLIKAKPGQAMLKVE